MFNRSTDNNPGGKPAKRMSRGTMIFLMLFSLPFAGAGTFVAYLAGSMLVTWVRAQSWQEVPARILSAELDVNRDDDSTTYRVRAEYEYEYSGTIYTSDRVAGGMGSDNIGSFHQNKHTELRTYAESGRLFRCFVNPEDPSESLLYRELRWGMLGFQVVFALVFSLFGYGLLFAAIYGSRAVKEAEALKERHAGEPWLWEKEWIDGRIQAGSRGKMIGAIIFALLWNLISSPIIFIVPGELEDGNRMILIGLLFPFVGVLLAAYAVYAVLQWRKFGSSEFELFSNPGVIGGYLEGSIHTAIRGCQDETFRVTLSCIRREVSGSGKNRSSSERTLWQDTIQVGATEVLAGSRGVIIPVRFAIPLDAGPDSSPDASTPITWRIDAAAQLPGINFSARFIVPVFRTPNSDPGVEVEIREDPLSEADKAGVLEAMGILREPTEEGGISYVFRWGRPKGAAIGLTVFTIIWCSFIWLMLRLDAPVLFPVVFGLFSLFMIMGLIDMWLIQTRVRAEQGRIVFNRRLIGSGRTLVFSAGDIAAIDLNRGMQAGRKLYYRIVLCTRGGKKYTLASRITNQRLARRLIKDLESAMTE